MSVKLGRQIPIGKGISGYEFEIRKSDAEDHKIYQQGLQIERDLENKKAHKSAPTVSQDADE